MSRYAAWWAFDFADTGNGFEGGYKTWTRYVEPKSNQRRQLLMPSRAADATSHLFFAYLRSLSPESAHGKSSILNLPLSLQQLLEATEYPPMPQEGLRTRTTKVAMIVETVSPTPFALLRRAKNFHYREEDQILQRFSDYDDPVDALTNECERVLKSVASANESTNAKNSTSLLDPSWSRFEDIGFSGFTEDFATADDPEKSALGKRRQQNRVQGLRATPASGTADLGRPTTPSWADFLSSGFQTDQAGRGPAFLLPPDKQLPPISISSRSATSQSHKRNMDDDSTLEPGELASITVFALDDTFWWVWMTSLAGEETSARKAAFGRCALVETNFSRQWLVMEEIIKGAAPEPEAGAYIAEKKSRFGFSRKTRLTRSKSSGKGALSRTDELGRSKIVPSASKTSIAPDQQARIQAAAAALQQKGRGQQEDAPLSPRRARQNDEMSIKTNSVLTLQPMIMSEAAPAMKWANTYDKNATRAKYLGDDFAGRGSNVSLLNGGWDASNASLSQAPSITAPKEASANKENVAPMPPKKPGSPTPRDETKAYSKPDTALVEMLNRGPPDGSGAQRKQLPPQPHPPPKEHVQNKPATITAPPAVPSKDQAPTPSKEVPPTAIPLPGEAPLPATPVREAPPPSVQRYPRPMERKPLPTQPTEVPPQAEKPVDKPEVNGKAVQSPPSPETLKYNKLKKKNAAGGFKGIFGRKKDQGPFDAPPRTSSTNSSAVAAAKAALEAKAARNQKAPDQAATKVASKRFSTIGRKKASDMSPELDKETAPMLEHDLGDHPALAAPGSPEEPLAADSERSQSMAETVEEQRAEREFQTFDQGPLEDVPVFVRDESPNEEHGGHGAGQPIHHFIDEEPPAEDAPRPSGAEPEEEENELARTISPNDRWAQIRKNAAERAAARQSEEQSRRTDRTDDDGDTSGEESKSPAAF